MNSDSSSKGRDVFDKVLSLFGPRLLLIFGDTLVLDRWRWIRTKLPKEPAVILDAGCGNGWLVLNCQNLGHLTTGFGWDDGDMAKAKHRARVMNLPSEFLVQDLRSLDSCVGFDNTFDVITCCETIEHIINDKSVVTNLANFLKPGGRLIMTAPNADYIPMDAGDVGPFLEIEDGRHVRKGYSPTSIRELIESAGLKIETIEYCSEKLSQSITKYFRFLVARLGYKTAWILIFPLRILPLLLENKRITTFPNYSICVVAIKS